MRNRPSEIDIAQTSIDIGAGAMSQSPKTTTTGSSIPNVDATRPKPKAKPQLKTSKSKNALSNLAGRDDAADAESSEASQIPNGSSFDDNTASSSPKKEFILVKATEKPSERAELVQVGTNGVSATDTKRKHSVSRKIESIAVKPKKFRKYETAPAATSSNRTTYHEWLDNLCDFDFQINYSQQLPVKSFELVGKPVGK